jgi:hypothetical protein
MVAFSFYEQTSIFQSGHIQWPNRTKLVPKVSGKMPAHRLNFHLRKPTPLMAAASNNPVEAVSGTTWVGGAGIASILPVRPK